MTKNDPNILTPQQEKFLQGLRMGFDEKRAASYAQYKNPARAAFDNRRHPVVSERMREIKAEHERRAMVQKEDVEKIILDAVDLARVSADPSAMIRGAAELSKMNGLYAPEKKQVEVTGKMKHIQEQYRQMDDEELLRITSDDVIEGEYEEVEEED